MNILASYDWLKEYVDLGTLTAEEFAARVSLSGPGIERLYPQGLDLEKVVLGHVLEVNPHPNADKLRLAVTDVGSKKVTIVCGGSNLEKDQWVAVALNGAKVRWHGEGELIELQPAEIRGVKSEGMICAANEIGLYDAFPHAEREIVDLGKQLPGLKMKPGTPLADVLGLHGDTLMDIEITTNRPDAFSLVGLAREASAILKRPMTWNATQLPKKTGKQKMNVKVEDKKLCGRYMGASIQGIKVGPSPWWLKRRLLSAGLRPINNVVDITNYVMLELGQPLHAFDADKLTGQKLVVRKAKNGEKMPALDGKTYELNDSMLVIADAERPQAVAGVMGAETSAATGDTKNVYFEAATFDPVSVRRTARALNLYSDAQLRFEKGLSVQAPQDALARAIELCLELCGGEVSAQIFDARTGPYKPASYAISFAKINELIGVEVKPKECLDTLKRLGFDVKSDKKKLTAKIPWWRDHDIEDGRDLVEEIARVFGYANLPTVFPSGKTNRQPSRELKLEDDVRTLAKGAGLTETYTYSFVSKKMLERVGYDSKMLLHIQNPLSSDFEFMRTSLLPSLVDVVLENQERARSQKLFEIQNVYYPTDKGWKDLPEERLELGAAFLGNETAWREAKGFVEHVLHGLGIQDVTWKRLTGDLFWHPGRTVQAWRGVHLLATVGELHPSLASQAGIEGKLALIDMPLGELFHVASSTRPYQPIPNFPQPKRDLAFILSREVEVQQMVRVMRATDPLVRHVEWFDTYAGKGMDEEKKSVAFHLTIGSDERTLESSEVDAVLERVKAAMAGAFDASVRS
ncbi:phenylalanine--tRNA ligase subunit beta [Candidatus Uhrbacteria bacterium]|nr:phenylalanine--tRNA ligase subunit beta [Candidatus Uhrbacteria bacterium]